MSRFSKAEAEARGWAFAHESEGGIEITSETQGRTREIRPSLRAEKALSGGGIINEEAETIGKLLERISLYEAQLESKQIEQKPIPLSEPFTGPVDDAGLPQRTVIVADAEGKPTKITEEEWASRSHHDSIVDEKGPRHTGPAEDATTADLGRSLAAQAQENERTAEADVGPTKQITIDETQDAIDNPGGAPQGTLVVSDEGALAMTEPPAGFHFIASSTAETAPDAEDPNDEEEVDPETVAEPNPESA